VSNTSPISNERGRLILAIDDDPMVHKLLEFSLKDSNYPLQCLPDAEAGQKFLSTGGPEVLAIILDWEMPGMSGLDFLEWLKSQEQYRTIPVIMLTGRNRKDEIKAGIDAGAYYYVTKPFNKDFLRSILQAAISDYLNLKVLKEQVESARNPFDTLIEGIFRIRSIEEAQKLSVLIANATPNAEETLIICELFNNAIEHGNLGISYLDKSNLIDSNNLQSEINRRLELPEYKNKFAEVSFKKDGQYLRVTIIDQGEGFDFNNYLKFDESRVFDTHGRGIALANSILNIRYMGKGNKVEVNIPLNVSAQANN